MTNPTGFDVLKEHVLKLGLEWPIKLSCNGQSEVWVPTRSGLTPLDERAYIEDPALNSVVQVVLEHQPGGGRFVLADDGLYLMSSESWLEWDEWNGTRARRGAGDPGTPGQRSEPTERRTRPRRIASRDDVAERFPDLRLHRLSGSVHNPKLGPLSQGGDT